jgi:NitT/TauT family transport system substrate-binding protein
LHVILGYLGIDAANDIRLVTDQSVDPLELFAQGKVDAFLGTPRSHKNCAPERLAVWSWTVLWTARGRSISAATWWQIRTSFASIVATKRMMRAFLKAADLCVSEPRQVAQLLVDAGSLIAMTMRCR